MTSKFDQNQKKKASEKIYAYQSDEMIAIWLQYHEPDVEEFQVSPRDVK